MRRIKVDEVKFNPEKVSIVEIPKGGYLKRIEIHLFGKVKTNDKSVVKDGGLAKAIKKITLTADTDVIFEVSGLSAAIKDIYDYATFKDINRLDRQPLFLDLEDQDITEDGMLSLLPTEHYNKIYLKIEWGKIEDIGTDIEIEEIRAEIIANVILTEELLKMLREEIKDSLEGQVPPEQLEEAIEEGVEAALATMTTRYVKEIMVLPKEQTDLSITVPEEGVCTNVLLITMSGDKLVDDLIDRFTVKSSSNIFVEEISFEASQNQDIIEYGLGNHVVGATMIEISGDVDVVSLVIKAKLKKLYNNAKIIVVAQYTRLNKKIEKVLTEIYENDEEDEDEE
jgi:hypothetical protein